MDALRSIFQLGSSNDKKIDASRYSAALKTLAENDTNLWQSIVKQRDQGVSGGGEDDNGIRSRDEIIKGIYKTLCQRTGVAQKTEVLSRDTKEVVKEILSLLPSEHDKIDQKHESVIKAVAGILNESLGIKIPIQGRQSKDLATDVFNTFRSIELGLQTEFAVAYKSVANTLSNVTDYIGLIDLLDANLLEMKDAVDDTNRDTYIKTLEQLKEFTKGAKTALSQFRMILQEFTSKNSNTAVSLHDIDKVKAVIRRLDGDFTSAEDIDETNVNNRIVNLFGSVVTNALLINTAFKILEVKNISEMANEDKIVELINKLDATKDPKTAYKIQEVKSLLQNFKSLGKDKRSEIIEKIKAMGDLDISGRGEEVSGGIYGGAPIVESKVGRMIRKDNDSKISVFRQFIKQIVPAFETVVVNLGFGKELNKSIAVTEDLIIFSEAISELGDFRNPDVFLALIGYDNTASGRDTYDRYMRGIDKVNTYIDKLKNDQQFSNISSNLSHVKTAIEDVKNIINKHKSALAQLLTITGSDDDDVVRLSGGISGGCEVRGAGVAGGAADIARIELEKLLPINNKSVYSASSKISAFKYFIRLSSIRDNLKAAKGELTKDSAKYDDTVSEMIANKIEKLNGEYTDFKTDVDALHLSPEKTKLMLDYKAKEFKTKRELYEVAQSMDKLLKTSTVDIIENPESLKDIKDILEDTDMIASWYDESSGDALLNAFYKSKDGDVKIEDILNINVDERVHDSIKSFNIDNIDAILNAPDLYYKKLYREVMHVTFNQIGAVRDTTNQHGFNHHPIGGGGATGDYRASIAAIAAVAAGAPYSILTQVRKNTADYQNMLRMRAVAAVIAAAQAPVDNAANTALLAYGTQWGVRTNLPDIPNVLHEDRGDPVHNGLFFHNLYDGATIIALQSRLLQIPFFEDNIPLILQGVLMNSLLTHIHDAFNVVHLRAPNEYETVKLLFASSVIIMYSALTSGVAAAGIAGFLGGPGQLDSPINNNDPIHGDFQAVITHIINKTSPTEATFTAALVMFKTSTFWESSIWNRILDIYHSPESDFFTLTEKLMSTIVYILAYNKKNHRFLLCGTFNPPLAPPAPGVPVFRETIDIRDLLYIPHTMYTFLRMCKLSQHNLIGVMDQVVVAGGGANTIPAIVAPGIPLFNGDLITLTHAGKNLLASYFVHEFGYPSINSNVARVFQTNFRDVPYDDIGKSIVEFLGESGFSPRVNNHIFSKNMTPAINFMIGLIKGSSHINLTRSNAEQFDQMYNKCKKAITSNSLLKNIIEIFIKFGGYKAGDGILPPSALYNRLIEYCTMSSMNRFINHVAAHVNVLPDLYDPTLIPANDLLIHFAGVDRNNLFNETYIQEDKLFTQIMKSIVTRIFTVVGVFDLFERPEGTLRPTPLRLLIGGSEGESVSKPLVHDDAVELYIRLLLYTEFYKDIFQKVSEETTRVNLAHAIMVIPDSSGNFGKLISIIFSENKNIADGAYSTNTIHKVISAINEIYQSYNKSGDSTLITKNIIRDFVNEINRRFGIVTKEDIRDLKDIENEGYMASSTTTGFKPRGYNRELIDGENDEFASYNAPSNKYLPVSVQTNTSISYKLDRSELEHERDVGTAGSITLNSSTWRTKISALEKFKEILSAYFTSSNYSGITKDDDTSFSVTFRKIDNIKRDVRMAKSQEEKSEILYRNMIGNDYTATAEQFKYVIFHETVITNLSVLVKLYPILEGFKSTLKGLDLFQKLVEAAMDNLSRIDTSTVAGESGMTLMQSLFINIATHPELTLDELKRITGFNEYNVSDISIAAAGRITIGNKSVEYFDLYGYDSAPAADPIAKRKAIKKSIFDYSGRLVKLTDYCTLLSSETQGLVTYKVLDRKLHVVLDDLIDKIENIMADTKYYLSMFDGFISSDILRKYGSSKTVGSYLWCQTYISDNLIKGISYVGSRIGDVTQDWRLTDLSSHIMRLSNFLMNSTNLSKFPYYKLYFNPNSCFSDREKIFINSLKPGTEISSSGTIGMVNSLPRKTLLYDLKSSKNIVPDLDDKFTYNNSVVCRFNELLAQYINTCMDPSAFKIYKPLLNELSNSLIGDQINSSKRIFDSAFNASSYMSSEASKVKQPKLQYTPIFKGICQKAEVAGLYALSGELFSMQSVIWDKFLTKLNLPFGYGFKLLTHHAAAAVADDTAAHFEPCENTAIAIRRINKIKSLCNNLLDRDDDNFKILDNFAIFRDAVANGMNIIPLIEGEGFPDANKVAWNALILGAVANNTNELRAVNRALKVVNNPAVDANDVLLYDSLINSAAGQVRNPAGRSVDHNFAGRSALLALNDKSLYKNTTGFWLSWVNRLIDNRFLESMDDNSLSNIKTIKNEITSDVKQNTDNAADLMISTLEYPRIMVNLLKNVSKLDLEILLTDKMPSCDQESVCKMIYDKIIGYMIPARRVDLKAVLGGAAVDYVTVINNYLTSFTNDAVVDRMARLFDVTAVANVDALTARLNAIGLLAVYNPNNGGAGVERNAVRVDFRLLISRAVRDVLYELCGVDPKDFYLYYNLTRIANPDPVNVAENTPTILLDMVNLLTRIASLYRKNRTGRNALSIANLLLSYNKECPGTLAANRVVHVILRYGNEVDTDSNVQTGYASMYKEHQRSIPDVRDVDTFRNAVVAGGLGAPPVFAQHADQQYYRLVTFRLTAGGVNIFTPIETKPKELVGMVNILVGMKMALLARCQLPFEDFSRQKYCNSLEEFWHGFIGLPNDDLDANRAHLGLTTGTKPATLRELIHHNSMFYASAIQCSMVISNINPLDPTTLSSLSEDDFTRALIFIQSQFRYEFLSDQFIDLSSIVLGRKIDERILTEAKDAFKKNIRSGYTHTKMLHSDINLNLPKDGSVLLLSVAESIKQIMQDRDEIDTAKYRFITDSLTDISITSQERLSILLPTFEKLFMSLSKETETIKSIIQVKDTKFDNSSSVFGANIYTYMEDYTTAFKAERLNSKRLLQLKNNLIPCSEAVDSNPSNDTLKQLYTYTCDAIINGCSSIITSINNVSGELPFKPEYLEVRKDFVSQYQNTNGKLPFMPLSSATFDMQPLKETNGLHSSTLIPNINNETDEFKYQYGMRYLMSKYNIHYSLDKMQGVKDVFTKMNVVFREDLKEDFIKKSIENTVSMIRYNLDLYNYGLSNLSETFPEVLMIYEKLFRDSEFVKTYQMQNTSRPKIAEARRRCETFNTIQTVDAMSGYLLKHSNLGNVVPSSINLTSLLLLSTNTNQSAEFTNIINLVNAKNSDSAGRKTQQVENIFELNIIPFNLNMLQRDIPLIHLVNYASTFDDMVIEFVGLEERASELKGVTPPATSNEMYVKLLIKPYEEMDIANFRLHYSALIRGQSAIGHGRIKFIGDQIYSKIALHPLMIEHAPTADYVMEAQQGDAAALNARSIADTDLRGYYYYVDANGNGRWVQKFLDITQLNVGFRRFNLKLVRHIHFLTLLHHLILTKISKELEQHSDIIIKSYPILDPAIIHFRGNEMPLEDSFKMSPYNRKPNRKIVPYQ